MERKEPIMTFHDDFKPFSKFEQTFGLHHGYYKNMSAL